MMKELFSSFRHNYWHMLFLCILSIFSVTAFASEHQQISAENLRRGVTDISQSVYDLHMFVIWVCVAIAVVVYGVLLYSIIAYRKSKGTRAANFSHSLKAEIIWTAVPIVILVFLAVPTIQVLAKMYDSSESELDILVTGYQWRWSYEYLDDGVKFFSNMVSDSQDYSVRDQIQNIAPKDDNYLLNVDNPLVIPIDTKVRFLVTSNDVLHAWWVPDFAVKRDAVPGYVNESWTVVNEPGTYRGQCTELCGKDHAYMPVVVEAVTKDEYLQWIADQKAAQQDEADLANQVWEKQALLDKGKQVYTINCVACHQATGQGNPPMFPSLVGGDRVIHEDKAVTINILLYGVQGSAMQAFGKQLNDVDIAAVVTYIRSSWGNNPSDKVVQPQEVATLRK